MERLREEEVTKFLIGYLKHRGFTIFSYDFPQSGTGYILRPNSNEVKHKNIGFWIPDIISIKDGILLLFENKDHYPVSDIKKIQKIAREGTHSESLNTLMKKTATTKYYILLAFPETFFKKETGTQEFIDAEIGCDTVNGVIKIKSNQPILSELID